MAEVHAPMFISSRLMAALKVEGAGTLHLEAIGGSAGRIEYRWVIEDIDGNELGEGADLSSGCGADVDYTRAMVDLLSFLTACAESIAYARYSSSGEEGENADLFPRAIGEWADANSDALSMAEYDLEYEDEDEDEDEDEAE